MKRYICSPPRAPFNPALCEVEVRGSQCSRKVARTSSTYCTQHQAAKQKTLPLIAEEPNFASRDEAVAFVKAEGATLWDARLAEARQFSVYRESKMFPGNWAWCVVFRRTGGSETWSRGSWLLSHDGAPKDAVTL